jgi:hypothetical protein
MANGSIPQAVQRGALIPATAWPAMGVLRDCPTGSMLQKSSGASAVTPISTWRAVVPSACVPVLADEPVASATVAKKAGALTVLVRLPVVWPISSEPKLYLFPR